MKPIVVEKNEKGKIELTIEELQKMLDDAYHEGLSQAKVEYIPNYQYSYLTTPTYKYTITCTGENNG